MKMPSLLFRNYIDRFMLNEVAEKRLLPLEHSLFIFICLHDSGFIISAKDLADHLNIHLETARVYLKKLIDCEYLKRGKGRGKVYSYELGSFFNMFIEEFNRVNIQGGDLKIVVGGRTFIAHLRASNRSITVCGL